MELPGSGSADDGLRLAGAGSVLKPGDQHIVATWVQARGGHVLLAGEDGSPSQLVGPEQPLPEPLGPLMGIRLPRGSVGVDHAMEALAGTAVARGLVLLELAGTDLGSRGAAALLGMVRLVRLDVSDTRIAARDLNLLRALPELERLVAEGVEGNEAADDGRLAPLEAGLAPAALAVRRGWARAVDWCLALTLLEGITQDSPADGTLEWLLQGASHSLAAAGILLVYESLGLAAVGRTLGKALLGLGVVAPEAIGLGRAFRRSAGSVLIGMGAGLPILGHLLALKAGWTLASGRRAPWDRRAGTLVKATVVPASRTWLAAALCAACLWWRSS